MGAAFRASAQSIVSSASTFQSKTVLSSIAIKFGDAIHGDLVLLAGPLTRSLGQYLWAQMSRINEIQAC